MRRILSLGGGGIKGAMVAAYLAHLEDQAQKPLADYFDLIAGTSTGGIIAIGLALGVRARDIVKFYEEDGPKIFPKDLNSEAMLEHLRHLLCVKYSATPLRSALKAQFGNRRLGEATTRLVIPAVMPSKAEPYLFKTQHHRLFRRDHLLDAVDVALATSAAPSYLPPHNIQGVGEFADGGLWANNPVGVAVAEAVSYLSWRPEDIRVLSVECPQEPHAIPAGAASKWMLGPPVLQRLGALQSAQAKGTALALMRDVGNLPYPERFYEALQSGFEPGYFGLDKVSQIKSLIGVGDAEARKHFNQIETVFLQTSKESFVPLA